MKNLFKKAGALILSASFAAGIAGCGEKKTATTDGDDESVPYEIIWYYIGTEQPDHKMVNDKVNEYLKEKINATVVMTPLDWGPFATKMSNISASGEKYDLRWISGQQYQELVAKGAFLELDDLLDKYAPKTKEVLQGDYIAGAQVSNKLYAIPANKDKAESRAIYCRKDMVEKYNMDLSGVKTFKDMWPFFEIIAKNEPNMYAYQMSGTKEPWYYTGFDDVGGNKLVGFVPGQEDKVVNLYATDLFRESADVARDMYNRGFIYKDCDTDDGGSAVLRKQGRIFAWEETGHPGKLKELNASEPYEYVSVLVNEAVMKTASCEGSMMAIPYTCENPARVMKFIELLNTDEYLNNLIIYGIEDVHYKKIGEKRIKRIEDAGYGTSNMQWVYGNTFINYLMEDEDEDKFEKLAEYNDNAKRSRYLGFVPNFESVRVEQSACNNVAAEFKTSIMYGTVDASDVLPEFIDKLNKAGIQNLVDEVQKQYDEWKAEKGN